jgi:hypothetical protein
MIPRHSKRPSYIFQVSIHMVKVFLYMVQFSTYIDKALVIDMVNVHQDIVKVYVNTANVSHDMVYMSIYMEMPVMTC